MKTKDERLIKKLETLISRLPTTSREFQTIKNELTHLCNHANTKLEVNFYLNHLPKKFTVINDLYLNNVELFKLDTLIITSHAMFILHFENTNNTLSHLPIINDYILHDFSRVKTSQANLYQWLKKRNFHNVPVYFLIVLPDHFHHHIKTHKSFTLAKHIPSKIIQYHNYNKQFHHDNKILMQHIIHKINSDRKRFKFNVLKQYKINKNILKTGVRCHMCQQLNMIRVNDIWRCEHCHNQTQFAHRKALNDYFILFEKPICIYECKWFLNIKSKMICKQILRDEQLTYNSKQKKWILFNPLYNEQF